MQKLKIQECEDEEAMLRIGFKIQQQHSNSATVDRHSIADPSKVEYLKLENELKDKMKAKVQQLETLEYFKHF